MRRVGNAKPFAKHASSRLQRVKASNAVISRRLMKMNGDSSPSHADAKRARMLARNRMKRMSTKTKNRRVPPNRWGKKKTSPSPEISEEESPEEADEDENERDESEDEDDEDEDEQDELDNAEGDEDDEDEDEQDELDNAEDDEADRMDVDGDDNNSDDMEI